MSMLGNIVRENDVQFFCQKIAAKIGERPEATQALKELGREILEVLPKTPKWSYEYHDLFRP